MSLLPTVGAIDQDTGFYNGAVSNSLRLNGTSSTLTRTLVNSTDGSRQKNVWSFWTKFNVGGSSPNPYFYSKGDGGGVADIVYIQIASNQRLQFIGYVGDSVTHQLITTRKFRDPNAWYHIVVAVDTTQTTDANKVCIYVNGVKETAFDAASYPSTNALLAMNWYQTGNAGSTVEMISDYRASPHEDYRLDGYLAEYHSVDGLSFFSDTSGTANTSFNINSFGETKNGVWIPVEYTGSHGTQGYHLKFNNTSVGTGASDTVGADTAGSNHWTSASIDAHDCNVPDCPENNFPVMNNLVLTNGTGVSTFSEGNLYIAKTGTTYSYFQSSFGVKTGKWYAECRLDGTINTFMIGITEANMETYRTGSEIDPHFTAGTAWYGEGGYGYFDGSNIAAGTFSSSTSIGDGDVVGLALDLDSSTKTIKWYKNGSLAVSKDLTANFVDHIVFALNLYNTNTAIWNFGQDSTFSGNESAGTNTDENGIGKFHESVPSGYLALCSANLEDADYATIGPSSDTQADDHFDVLLYTGTGNDNLDVSGLKFKPDLVWKKSRTENVRNTWTDSSRGTGKDLFSDLNGQESADTNGIKAFNAPSSSGATDGGFRLGQSTNHNVDTKTYVAWNWKADDNSADTNDASATSIGNLDSVSQANTTAGFSIVTYTGQDSATTVAHGLGAVPAMAIIKQRTDNSTDWIIGHKELNTNGTGFANNKFLKFDRSNGTFTNSAVFGATPTTTAIQLTASAAGNLSAASKTFVMYCWAEVEGYSKFGKYTTNASADGPFVYTGFKPSFVMVRVTGGSSNTAYWSWAVHDDTRVGFNPRHSPLFANLYRPEGYRGDDSTSSGGSSLFIDFLSNGFKERSGGTEQNGVAGTEVIYMAFAESPFKYANAE